MTLLPDVAFRMADPEEALALCMEGKATSVDVGKANEHWFLNAASIGFGAEVTATTPSELKHLLGPAAYGVMGAILAMNVHHYRGTLTLPDREITGSGPAAIVGNGRQAGGGLQLPLEHASTTGYWTFSPFAISLRGIAHRRARVTRAFTGWRVYQLLADPLGRGPHRGNIPVNLDGEPVQFSSVRYEAVPRAIRLIVPPDCPLLSAQA